MIAAAVGEALQATNAALFPAEGAAGLASNSQTWLREPRLQSPGIAVEGRGSGGMQTRDARCERARQKACAGMPGCCEGTPTEGMRQHHGHS